MNMPIWRSLLFVPAHLEKFVSGAPSRGADACILDLEDSVPADSKAEALAALPAAVALLAEAGIDVLVRVNAPYQNLEFEACAAAGVDAIVLPKVESAQDVHKAAAMLPKDAKPPGLIAQIESVQALSALDEIANADDRLLGMSLGSEDFSDSAGMEPVPQALLWPNQQVVFACRRAGIQPYGFPASIADYADIEAFRGHVQLARQLGFVGAFCIHPSQVPVLNEAFTPNPAQIAEAEAIVQAYNNAGASGRGAFAYRGKMVDAPVVRRAEALLARARLIDQDSAND